MIRAATEPAEFAPGAGPALAGARRQEPGTDDPSLVRGARAGDRASFARLYERYAPLVHGVLLARVARHEADDLMQDVFVLAWRKLGTLRDAGAVAGWLVVLARRAAAGHRRSAWARGMVALLAARPEPEARPERSRLDVDDVLAALRGLPEAYRETLALRLVERMSGPQIAARLGMTPGSVRVNLCKGMALLRRRLGLENEP